MSACVAEHTLKDSEVQMLGHMYWLRWCTTCGTVQEQVAVDRGLMRLEDLTPYYDAVPPPEPVAPWYRRLMAWWVK